MGLYNFQKRFVPMILDDSKTHTIRAERKIVEKVGNTMHLYTGLRQSGAQLLKRAPCVKVEPIEIVLPYGEVEIFPYNVIVRINDIPLEDTELDLFAWRDGFRPDGSNDRKPGRAFPLMVDFWLEKNSLDRKPFNGHIIHWKKGIACSK